MISKISWYDTHRPPCIYICTYHYFVIQIYNTSISLWKIWCGKYHMGIKGNTGKVNWSLIIISYGARIFLMPFYSFHFNGYILFNMCKLNQHRDEGSNNLRYTHTILGRDYILRALNWKQFIYTTITVKAWTTINIQQNSSMPWSILYTYRTYNFLVHEIFVQDMVCVCISEPQSLLQFSTRCLLNDSVPWKHELKSYSTSGCLEILIIKNLQIYRE